MLKFDAFIRKNVDIPFSVKQKVFEAAVLSSILYGCESWLTKNLSTVKTSYMHCVKSLLSVRKTTPSDTCLIEAGLPTLSERVCTIQKNCYTKLLVERDHSEDDPLTHVWSIVSRANTPGARYINAVIGSDPTSERKKLKDRLLESEKSRYITYRSEMNPELCVHPMYKNLSVAEHERIVATRIRLSSHNLAIEKGRWSRIPRERRLCSCGQVQTENHILSECPDTASIRALHPSVTFEIPMFFQEETLLMCKLCAKMTKDYV